MRGGAWLCGWMIAVFALPAAAQFTAPQFQPPAIHLPPPLKIQPPPVIHLPVAPKIQPPPVIHAPANGASSGAQNSTTANSAGRGGETAASNPPSAPAPQAEKPSASPPVLPAASAGPNSKPLPPAVCTGFGQPAKNSAPNDAAVVCACGEQYLKGIAKEAASLHQGFLQLSGKPKHWPDVAMYFATQPIGGVHFTPEETEQAARGLAPLEAYAQSHIAACERWNADRGRLADVPGQFQLADRLNGQIEQLKASRDDLLRQNRELVSQPYWAKSPANVQLHDRLQNQLRDTQANLGQIGGQHDRVLQGAKQLQATLEAERTKARDYTYSEIETAMSGLWMYYLGEGWDQVSEINGEEADFERQLYAQWVAACGRVGSPDNCEPPGDNGRSGKVDELLSREEQMAKSLVDTRDRLAMDALRWAAYASPDAWPAAGMPKSITDYDTGRVVLRYSFEEVKHLLFDPEVVEPPPSPAVLRDPDGVTMDKTNNLRFTFLTGASGRELMMISGPPHFHLVVGPVPVGRTGHPCEPYSGRLPDGVHVFNYFMGEPADANATLTNCQGVYLVFSVFNPEAGEKVMYASGADKSQRP